LLNPDGPGGTVGVGLAVVVGSTLGAMDRVGLGAVVAEGAVVTDGALLARGSVEGFALAGPADAGADEAGGGGTSVAQLTSVSADTRAATIQVWRRVKTRDRRCGVIAANDTRTHHSSNGRLPNG
jgi:hypothetical protein